jgi:N-acetylneuraminic acid mutarotase
MQRASQALAGVLLAGFLGLIQTAASDFTWQTVAPMLQARSDLASVGLNGKIYAIGGYVGGYSRTAAVEEYDPAANTWTFRAPLSAPLSGPGAAVCNGRLFVLGGFMSLGSPSSYLTVGTVEEYDSTHDLWMPRATMPQPVYHPAVGVIDGKIYLAGGYCYSAAASAHLPVATLQIYDPATDAWSAGAPLPVAGGDAYGAGAIGRKLYVVGDPMRVYDAAADRWDNQESLPPTGLALAPACTVANGRLYTFGGRLGSSGFLTTVSEFEPLTSTWVAKDTLPTGVWHWPAASVAGDRVYVLGGIRVESEQSSSAVQQGTPRTAPVIPRGLVGYFPFDRDAKDYSGLNHESTVVGNVSFEPGRIGGAARLEGKVCEIPGYVRVASSSALKLTEEATVAVWVNIAADLDYGWFACQLGQGGVPTILAKGARFMSRVCDYGLNLGSEQHPPGGSQAGQFFWESSRQPDGAFQWNPLSQVVPKGEWHHLAATFDHGLVTVYIDAVPITACEMTTPLMTSDDPLYIGLRLEGGFAYPAGQFRGLLDEVRIYNIALTGEQIADIAQIVIPPPCTIICPDPMTVRTAPDATDCGAIVEFPAPTTTGDCGPVTCVPPSGSFFPVGTTTVHCTTENGQQCEFTVTVVDATPPGMTCPPNATVPADPGTCEAVVNPGMPTATDHCSPVVIQGIRSDGLPLDAPYPRGVTTIAWTAIDASGNPSSCAQTITVVDLEPPAIQCPATIGLPCSVEQYVLALYEVTATDNCPGPVAIVLDPPSGSGFPIGETVVTATATDAAGNQSQATFRVIRAALDFAGFLPPLGGADATGGSFQAPLRTIKVGSTVPVKFLAGCESAPVLTGSHRLQVVRWLDPTAATPPIDAKSQDRATIGNQFRLADGQWHFNLDTKLTGMTTGIWQLMPTLSDGSQHEAWIQLK